MLREVFGEYSLSRTAAFEWYSRFKAGRVLVEDDKNSGRLSTSKMTEMLKKFENSSMKIVAEQSMSSQTPSGSVTEMPGDLNKKFEHAPHCRGVCSPTLDK
jgi:hypothetical protein